MTNAFLFLEFLKITGCNILNAPLSVYINDMMWFQNVLLSYKDAAEYTNLHEALSGASITEHVQSYSNISHS